ncbi:P-loop containing nucleoside triphosphate hydrolase [Sesbania bispinosa]|nr:P-loop containing nucleoside triphosphate hydrolase [Sesbania bispinosa]
MGGIGKTTLAAAVFQKVSCEYEGSCFLENVTEELKRHGLNYICNRLFSKLLREDLGIDTPMVVPSNVMRRLRRMKAFIVLDDVNSSKLLENLGTGAVEVIWLDMTQIAPINLSSEAFEIMPNLRLLAFQGIKWDSKIINSVYLPKGLKLLPKNLRYFEWDGYPSKSLPPTFCPEKLVELSLPYNNVEKLWDGIQKLEVLSVSGCTSLKSLCSNSCSPSLRELYAARCPNLQEFSITLMPQDPSTTPFCLNLGGSELPDNISSLSSLEYLRLYDCTIISLPKTIEYLPRLQHLEVDECKKLQSIPALPQSIQCFHAWNCESLEEVLSSMTEPSMKHECTFLFPNCVNLNEDSYHAILKDATVGIELGAKPLSEVVLEDHEDDDEETYAFETVRSGKVCYFLPARSDKLRELFSYHSTQALFTVELPPNLVGLVFYLVLSQVQSCHIGYGGSFGCECCLETSWDEEINITSFFVAESIWFNYYTSFEMMSDHVFLWYDAECCKQIMEAIKESRKVINHRRARYKAKITFEFFAQNMDNEEEIIKECGLRWIYPSEDQIVEKGGGCKSKRSREDHELEASKIQNRDVGSESDKQEEMIPPTKKLKQIFGTPSNLESNQEMEDLR